MARIRTSTFDHARTTDVHFTTAATSANSSTEVYIVASDRNLKFHRATWIPAGSLAASDSAYAVLTVTDASANVLAQYSSKLTGGDGAFVSGTHVNLNATANAWAAPGALKFVVTVVGAPAVPAGHLHIEAEAL